MRATSSSGRPTTRLPADACDHLIWHLPEPQSPVTDREDGGAHPAALAVAQQVGPRLAGLAEPVGQGDQLLGAVDADPDHHQ